MTNRGPAGVPGHGAASDGVVAGRYRLIAPLGAGGMGTVWEALDLETRREVALKRLHPGSAGDEGQLEREIHALARLRHPNLVSVLDAGTTADGTRFLTMDIVRGVTLRGELEKVGKLSPERACRIGVQVARGLLAAHAEGVIHRDLKPSNIMLSELYGERDVARLIDFGLAQLMDATQRSLSGSAFAGTPRYASPEQARGEAVLASSDLYSLGVVLYEAVTGQSPFEADSAMGFLFHHVYTTPAPPSRLEPALPGWFDELLLRLLQKSSSDRPQSAREVVDCFEQSRSPRVSSARATGDSPEVPRFTASLPVKPARRRALQRAAIAVGTLMLMLVLLRVWARAPVSSPAPAPVESAQAIEPVPPPRAELVQLTKLSEIGFPALSPSGKHLLYGEVSGTTVLDINAGTRKHVSPWAGNIECARWYPDDRYLLATIRNNETVQRRTKQRKSLCTLDSETTTITAHDISVDCPIVSPDARRLTFRSGDGSIVVREFPNWLAPEDRDANERRLPSSGRGKELAWSPDGKWIAHYETSYAGSEARFEIVASRVDSEERRVLLRAASLHQPGGNAAFAWLSTWELVFFAASPSGGEIRALTLDPSTLSALGGERILATTPHTAAVALTASEDGRRLSVALGDVRDDVALIQLDPSGGASSKPKQVSAPPNTVVQGWLDDGHLILRPATGTEGSLLIYDLATGKSEPWLAPSGLHPQLTGTGRVAYFRERQGAPNLSDLFIGDTTGNGTLVEAASAIALPRPLSGAELLLRCARQVARCLWAPPDERKTARWLDVESGQLLGTWTLQEPSPRALAVSANGQVVAFARSTSSQGQIVFSDQRGRALTTVALPLDWYAEELSFRPDSAGVYATGSREDESWVYYVGRDRVGRELTMRRAGKYHSPAVSPDGRQLAVNIRAHDSNVWLLERSTETPLPTQ